MVRRHQKPRRRCHPSQYDRDHPTADLLQPVSNHKLRPEISNEPIAAPQPTRAAELPKARRLGEPLERENHWHSEAASAELCLRELQDAHDEWCELQPDEQEVPIEL